MSKSGNPSVRKIDDAGVVVHEIKELRLQETKTNAEIIEYEKQLTTQKNENQEKLANIKENISVSLYSELDKTHTTNDVEKLAMKAAEGKLLDALQNKIDNIRTPYEERNDEGTLKVTNNIPPAQKQEIIQYTATKNKVQAICKNAKDTQDAKNQISTIDAFSAEEMINAQKQIAQYDKAFASVKTQACTAPTYTQQVTQKFMQDFDNQKTHIDKYVQAKAGHQEKSADITSNIVLAQENLINITTDINKQQSSLKNACSQMNNSELERFTYNMKDKIDDQQDSKTKTQMKNDLNDVTAKNIAQYLKHAFKPGEKVDGKKIDMVSHDITMIAANSGFDETQVNKLKDVAKRLARKCAIEQGCALKGRAWAGRIADRITDRKGTQAQIEKIGNTALTQEIGKVLSKEQSNDKVPTKKTNPVLEKNMKLLENELVQQKVRDKKLRHAANVAMPNTDQSIEEEPRSLKDSTMPSADSSTRRNTQYAQFQEGQDPTGFTVTTKEQTTVAKEDIEKLRKSFGDDIPISPAESQIFNNTQQQHGQKSQSQTNTAKSNEQELQQFLANDEYVNTTQSRIFDTKAQSTSMIVEQNNTKKDEVVSQRQHSTSVNNNTVHKELSGLWREQSREASSKKNTATDGQAKGSGNEETSIPKKVQNEICNIKKNVHTECTYDPSGQRVVTKHKREQTPINPETFKQKQVAKQQKQ